MSTRDPSRIGQFALGYARLGVYRPMYWENQFKPHSRTVTWRVANMNVDRDTTTGHRTPTYTLTHSISGVFEEMGGTLLPLPVGYVQRGDAVFRCFDNVVAGDQIQLLESLRYYEVQYVTPHYEKLMPADVTSFCYRICDLHYEGLYKEI